MDQDRSFYTYIMASATGVLYVGFSNDLFDRVQKHKIGFYDGFTKKYACHKLVYYEEYDYPLDAIAREKQIKKWNRNKKINLIKTINPSWMDLSLEW